MDAVKYKTLSFKYKLARFSTLLIKAYPFLGEVCMRVEKYKNYSFGMAATDGYRLYLNDIEMNNLPEESFNFVLLHELFHIILTHMYPRHFQYYEKIYWNISFDLIVNWLILSMQYELKQNNLPVIPIKETSLCNDDLSADLSHVIAKTFIQQAKDQGILSEKPPVFVEITWKSFNAYILNSADYVFDVLDNGLFGNTPTEGAINELLASCLKSAGNKGVPWKLQGLIDELVKGRNLPWYLILKKFLEESFKNDDFDFNPPDKRLLYSKIIIPASNTDDKSINNALIILDVSSSVAKDELTQQLWQITTVLSDLEFTGSILSFGSSVYQEANITNKESLKYFINELEVGGGTNWDLVVDHVKEKYSSSRPIIVFTDGYFYQFSEGLKNVFFIVNGKAPESLKKLGKVIEI